MVSVCEKKWKSSQIDFTVILVLKFLSLLACFLSGRQADLRYIWYLYIPQMFKVLHCMFTTSHDDCVFFSFILLIFQILFVIYFLYVCSLHNYVSLLSANPCQTGSFTQRKLFRTCYLKYFMSCMCLFFKYSSSVTLRDISNIFCNIYNVCM